MPIPVITAPQRQGKEQVAHSGLFPREHRLGLAFQVHVRVAADVDSDLLDGAASEVVR
jgi:hypothetical protein